VTRFFPGAKARTWSFLKSSLGGKPQPAHRDFLPISDTVDLYDYSQLPASVIIGSQDDSFIYGYGWNRQVAMEREKEVIRFGKGDVLIFRSDFIHGGGDYMAENVRLHVFLEPKGTPRKQLRKSNSLTLIRVIPKKVPTDESNERKCIVRGCELTFSSTATMRKHTRTTHKFRFNNYPTHIRQPPRNVLEGRAYTAGNDQTKSARQAFTTTKQRETVAALEDAEGQAEDACGWSEAEGDMEPDRATLADASVPKKCLESARMRKQLLENKRSQEKRGRTASSVGEEHLYQAQMSTKKNQRPLSVSSQLQALADPTVRRGLDRSRLKLDPQRVQLIMKGPHPRVAAASSILSDYTRRDRSTFCRSGSAR